MQMLISIPNTQYTQCYVDLYTVSVQNLIHWNDMQLVYIFKYLQTSAADYVCMQWIP